MPQVTVFCREEDLPIWKSIEKKSQWLHDHLQKTTPPESKEAKRPSDESTVRRETIKPQTQKPDKAYTFCKHNQIKGLCRFGCK